MALLKKDKKLKDHVIVCGLGLTAEHIVEALESYREKPADRSPEEDGIDFREYLVIDSSVEAIERMQAKWPKMEFIVGDASDDDVLEQAGIRHAYGIFPVLSSERDNLYITMASRQLNPSVRIVARTADVFDIGVKLSKAGADAVVSPNFIGGLRLVSEIARPHATEFLDELLHHRDMRLKIAEVTVTPGSELCGLTLREASFPEKFGLLVIAMKGPGGLHYQYNPSAEMRIEERDTLVVMGYTRQIGELQKSTAP